MISVAYETPALTKENLTTEKKKGKTLSTPVQQNDSPLICVEKNLKNSLPGLAGALYERGLLSQDQAKVLLREQKKSGKLLEDLVVNLGFLDHRVLEEFLSQQQGVRFFNPEEHFLDPSCLAFFSKEKAQHHHVLPLHIEGDTLFVAMRDIHDVVANDAVKTCFPDKRVQAFSARSEDLSYLLEEAYGLEGSLDGILDDFSPKLHVVGQGHGHGHTESKPAIRFLEALLRRAVKDRASDIHLEPDHFCAHVRYRIDGVLQQTFSFHKDSWSEIRVAIKMMAKLHLTELQEPQNGRFTRKLYGREVDFRVATHPTIYGDNIVIRVLDKLYALKSLDDLGFQESHITLLKKHLASPEGLILLTGPTGSGKTTTLYSMLSYLQSTERNIMTLEEPVEYEVRGIRQSAIKDIDGLRFSDGVRSLLRQDPDIIFIGEIRDIETAKMAIQASMTGHLVLSTLHSKDSVGALQRLQELGMAPGALEGNLLSIVAQRLVRRLCPDCGRTESTLKTPLVSFQEGSCDQSVNPHKVSISPPPQEQSPQQDTEQGCEACHQTGYKGRIAIAEVLEITESIDALIGKNKGRSALLDQAKKENFIKLYDHGLKRIQANETSAAEIYRVLGAA